MRSKNLLEFSVNTAVEDARKVMANVRHRYFPILDANGKYCGVISRRNLLNVHRKQVIMVDHNERGQAVDGLEQAEILEIIDHHRLGALETAGPVYFRNEPVGCTATIISRMYEEHGIEIPPQIAGLLLSAILSDTLMFRSPTSTPLDQHIAEKLARIAGEEIPTYAEQMFEAGADLTGRTADDVFFSDFKVFSRGDAKFGVGQAIYMTSNSRSAAEALITPFCRKHWPRPVCPWCSLCAPICVPRPQTCCSAVSRRKKLCAAHSMWKPRTAKLCCPGLSAAKSS